MSISKKRKVLIALLASITGLSGVTVASSLIAYDAIYPRYERPDYTLYPGLFCYERLSHELPRTLIRIPSGKIKLQGYYYQPENGKGLVIVSHGMKAGGDDYLPIIKFLYDNGFNVLSYDCTGTFDSEGESTIGACQSLVDLDNVLKFVKNSAQYKNLPLFLIGHSWGGYAVTSVLSLHKNINACVAIAPMNDGSTIMMEKSEQYAGKLALIPKPIFSTYQKILFGDYPNHNGVRGINSCSIPVLIAQGVDDKVITYDKNSVTAHRDKITNPNVEYFITKGIQGEHNSIMHSVDALLYQKEVESDLKLLAFNKGGELTNEEKVEFYKTIDHERYSAVNTELMNKVLQIFNKTL